MLGRLASFVFGGSCFVCRGAARELLCAACEAELPRLGEGLCPRCALASPGGAVCERCLANPPHYDATVAALAYAFPADILVHALKFRGELALASLLGRLLAERLSALEPVDLVIPVPLSGKRLAERGYNQAMEIARHVAPVVRARLEAYLCTRTRDTLAQVGLSLEEREKNVRGAFVCRRDLSGAAVAVVDDVMTTGATLDEIAATLKRAGARRVANWVVARTPAPGE